MSTHHDRRAAIAEGGRFRILSSLGSGGTCEVWRVRDGEHGDIVALKALRRLDATSLYRLKREFRLLSGIEHPNLVQYYELIGGVDEHDWLVTMEYVAGSDFLTWCRGKRKKGVSESSRTASYESSLPSQDIDLAEECLPKAASNGNGLPDLMRLRSAMRQLVEGVAAVHRAGQIHRDLKPGNVMVTPAGRAVILDFGLVAEADQDYTEGTMTDQIAGSAAYMAPEQAVGHRLTEAADWYAVGVMLYEALTGAWPYSGHVYRMLRAKQELDPVPPRVLVPECPEDLNQLCMALLHRDPERRPVVHQTRAALRGREVRVGFRPKEVGLHFRDSAMARMERALDATREGQLTVLELQGVTGSGRTALLREFVRRARNSGEVSFLKARCFPWEKVKLAVVDGLVDNLTRVLRRMDNRRVSRRFADPDLAYAIQAFPALERVSALSTDFVDVSDEPKEEIIQRGVATIGRTIGRLMAYKTVVLVVDDAHLAPIESARAFAYMIHQAGRGRLMVVLASDAENTGPMSRWLIPELTGLGARHHSVELTPLSMSACKSLAAAWLSLPEDDRNVAMLANESGGNPGQLYRLARQMVGLAERPGVVNAVVVSQVRGLPPGTMALLQVLCVADEPIPIEVLVLATRLGDEPAQHVSALLALGLMIEIPRQGRVVEAAGHELSEWVRSGMSGEMQRSAHMALANALEGHGGAHPLSLVRHFSLGGARQKAGVMAWMAGREALHGGRVSEAGRLLEQALQLGEWSAREERSVWIHLGQSRVMSGRCLDGAEAFKRVVELSHPADQARAGLQVARLQVTGGRVLEGEVAIEESLTRAGLPSFLGKGMATDVIRTARLWMSSRPDPLRSMERLDVLQNVCDHLYYVSPWRLRPYQTAWNRLAIAEEHPRHILLSGVCGLYLEPNPDTWKQLAQEIRGLDSGAIYTQSLLQGVGALVRGGFLDEAAQWLESMDGLLDLNRVRLSWRRLALQVLRVQVRLERGQVREALEEYRTLEQRVMRGPSDLTAASAAANVDLWFNILAGNPSLSVSSLESWIERLDNATGSLQLFEVWLALGLARLCTGDLAGVEKVIETVQEMDEGQALSQVVLAYKLNRLTALLYLHPGKAGEKGSGQKAGAAIKGLSRSQASNAVRWGRALEACRLAGKGDDWQKVISEVAEDSGNAVLAGLAARAGRCGRRDRAGVRVVEGRLQGMNIADPEQVQSWLLPGLPTSHAAKKR